MNKSNMGKPIHFQVYRRLYRCGVCRYADKIQNVWYTSLPAAPCNPCCSAGFQTIYLRQTMLQQVYPYFKFPYTTCTQLLKDHERLSIGSVWSTFETSVGNRCHRLLHRRALLQKVWEIAVGSGPNSRYFNGLLATSLAFDLIPFSC